jgi:hypothetical protein
MDRRQVGDADCMFLAGLYRAEQVIADRLIRIARGRLPSAALAMDRRSEGHTLG